MAKKKTLLRVLLRGVVKGFMTEPSKTRKNALRRAKRMRRSMW